MSIWTPSLDAVSAILPSVYALENRCGLSLDIEFRAGTDNFARVAYQQLNIDRQSWTKNDNKRSSIGFFFCAMFGHDFRHLAISL